MDFPKYIPPVIKKQAELYLFGDKVIRNLRHGVKDTGIELEVEFRSDSVYFEGLKRLLAIHDKGEVELRVEYIEYIKRLIAKPASKPSDYVYFEYIKRLITDWRMEDVYKILVAEYSDDEMDKFFYLGWFLLIVDFEGIRKANIGKDKKIPKVKAKDRRPAKVKKLAEGIQETADKLAEQVCEIQKAGLFIPAEFNTTEALVRTTNKDFSGVDDFPKLKKYLLQDMLKTLSNVASNFEPKLTDRTINDAMYRQRNEKNEYLRAYAGRLKRYDMRISPSIKKALAITATVALDLDVTVQDVRNLTKPQ